MKKDILKIAGVKSEKEFYKKYPTEAAFMKAHKKEFKKAAMGASMVNKQLTQITDFSNPPQAQSGWHSEWDQDAYSEITDTDAAYLAEMDARNIAESPMMVPSVNVPKSSTQAKKPSGNSNSIVDYLNSVGKKSDFNTRKALAESKGIKNYKGTAEQNMQLLSLIKGKPAAIQKVAQKPTPTSSTQKKEAPAQTKTTSPQTKTAATKAAEKPKLSKAEEYIAKDPYFFAEESDPGWIKTIDAPFAGLRNLGAKVALDQDPMALLKLLGMGAMSNSIIGQTKTMPYNPMQIPEVVGAARAAGKALPYATRALPGFNMGGYIPQAFDGEKIGGLPSAYQYDLYDPYSGSAKNAVKYNKRTGMIDSSTGQVSMADTQGLGFGDSGRKSPSRFVKDLSANDIQSGVQMGSTLGKNFQKISTAIEEKKKAKRLNALSPIVLQASGTRPEEMKRRYVRPEDNIVDPGQISSPYGTGMDFLQMAYGGAIGGNPTEIQNMYNPGDIYSDMGYEPLSDSEIVKQYRMGGGIPKAQGGMELIVEGVNTVGDIAAGIIGMGTKKLNKQSQQRLGQAAFQSGMQDLQENQYSGFMKSGGSIVDYMNSKGMDSSVDNRKKLYKKAFKDDAFSGSADQNTKLLNYLSGNGKSTTPIAKESVNPTSSKKQDFGPRPRTSATQFGSYDPTVFPENRNLESGVVVDKNTNIAHILQGNKIVKSFPVLTGQARDTNVNDRGVQYLENHPESRATPTGSYFMNPSEDIYGEPGFRLNPISAYGDPTPRAKSIAEHVTYDSSTRDKYYDLPGEQRNKSYGCVNCKKPNINELSSMFPQGDTTMVIDTRKLADKNLLSKMSKREDGGWVSHDWQPQVITQFGEYNMKDLLRDDPTMDTLRAGGHLKQYTPPSAEAMSTERPMMQMGGELQTHWGGGAETISQNPFLPGDGETIMFRGQSHDESDGQGRTGIGITYGDNPVEVERGEPAVKLQDGGEEESLVVYGNMKIPSYGVSELNDPKAKGKKFKSYINDLSKIEARQNKIIDKATSGLDESDINDPYALLSFNSDKANLTGAYMKLKDIAQKKQLTAGIQNAILDTAGEYGLDSDSLAKGKIKQASASDMAKFGAKMETAQGGIRQPLTPIMPMSTYYRIDPTTNFKLQTSPEVKKKLEQKPVAKKTVTKGKAEPEEEIVTSTAPYTPIPFAPSSPVDIKNRWNQYLPKTENVEVPFKRGYNSAMARHDMRTMSTTTNTTTLPILEDEKFDWMDLVRQAQPYLTPSNQEALDAAQLAPEMFALAANQLEPVQAQTFQPMLEEMPTLSFQDQLNEIQAEANAARRMAGTNPAAQSMISAQAAAAKNKVLGEQLRTNQAMQAESRRRNLSALNDATLKNLNILDQQYQRQAQAKSATKAQAQAALSSIADKIAKNKLENKTLGVYENMYNYRFGPKGRAYNVNAPVDFKTQLASMSTEEIQKMLDEKKSAEKKSEKKSGKNGSIVKAIKNL